MSVTPTGPINLPLVYLRNSVAGSTNFRTWVGAASAAAALPYIHYYGINPPKPWAASTAFALREFARVAAGASFVYECTTAGTSGTAEPTWPTVAGGTVTDGTVVWTARAMYALPDNSAVRHSRPFAVVDIGDNAEKGAIGTGAYLASGSVLLSFEADVPAAYANTVGDAWAWFANQVGAVVDDILDLSGQATYLAISGVKVIHMGRVKLEYRKDEGDAFLAQILVSYEG